MAWIYQLARRLSEQERFEAYRDAFSKGRALATICRKARALAGQRGRSRVGNLRPEEERQLSEDHEAEIRTVVMSRAKAAAQDGSLLDSKMAPPLYFWEEYAKEMGKLGELSGWVTHYIEDDKGLARFLETFLGYLRDMNGERKEPHVPIDSLRTFLTPLTIIDRARALLKEDWVEAEQKVAVETFVREYDAMKKARLDTDMPPEP